MAQKSLIFVVLKMSRLYVLITLKNLKILDVCKVSKSWCLQTENLEPRVTQLSKFSVTINLLVNYKKFTIIIY